MPIYSNQTVQIQFVRDLSSNIQYIVYCITPTDPFRNLFPEEGLTSSVHDTLIKQEGRLNIRWGRFASPSQNSHWDEAQVPDAHGRTAMSSVVRTGLCYDAAAGC
eukprot:2147992-Rhodomonas_salina.2